MQHDVKYRHFADLPADKDLLAPFEQVTFEITPEQAETLVFPLTERSKEVPLVDLPVGIGLLAVYQVLPFGDKTAIVRGTTFVDKDKVLRLDLFINKPTIVKKLGAALIGRQAQVHVDGHAALVHALT